MGSDIRGFERKYSAEVAACGKKYDDLAQTRKMWKYNESLGEGGQKEEQCAGEGSVRKRIDKKSELLMKSEALLETGVDKSYSASN